MEYWKQEDFVSYMDDFRFQINTQGEGGEPIFCSFHWHEFIEILYCMEGTVQITIENIEYALQPGDMLLIGPNVVHKSFKGKQSNGMMYNVVFDPAIIQNINYCSLENKCINSFLKYLSDFNYHYIKNCVASHEMGEILKKMKRCYYSYREYNCIYIRAYLLELIGKLCEYKFFEVEKSSISKQNMDAINDTIKYMQTHYNEKITLSDMAKRANLSYYYYSKLFGIVTGKTFSDFLASVRIFAAEKLVIDGGYSLQEIADKVGLYPQSTFNHTYKRLRGFSPNEFIKGLNKLNLSTDVEGLL